MQQNADSFRLGELQSVDGYMNIALEKSQEYVSGQLKRSYGDAFIRGNNGICDLPSLCSTNILTISYGLGSLVYLRELTCSGVQLGSS